MIEELAVVTEKFESQVHLEIERKSACGICGQTRGCGNATWGKMLGHQQGIIKAENAINANIGDHVIVGINEKVFLNTTFLLYVVPLICLFVGAGLAQVIFNQEGWVMIGALLGLFSGFVLVKKATAAQATNNFLRLNKYSNQPYAVILRQSNAPIEQHLS